MLKKIRIALAALMFILITLLLLDISGTLHHYLGWMAKIQFLPAVLALNAGVVIALIVITLIFGRIYCSVICPLGVMQDVISWFHGKRKKNRFTYSAEKKWLRYPLLVVFIAAIVAGIGSFVALLAPYSSYGRIVVNLFKPIYEAGNNVLASIAEHFNSYAFYHVDTWIKSIPTLIIAAVTFVIIAILAWRGGRTYCNIICPVGTFLSFFSRFSLLKIHFDEEKCKNCSLCTKNCKASCIDYKNHTVFLIGAALATTATALAQEKKKVDGGLAAIEEKKAPQRTTAITPPGSFSAKNMQKHCTACQLCVSACPNQVLRPSTGLLTLMQPTMSYERGYCRPECNRCSQVCPAGAIKPITLEEKSSTQIGHAVWIKKNCIPVTDGVECGNCERHCPTGAIEMEALDPDDEMSVMIPTINEAKCIGCGACENLCPANPFSAIYVEGHEMHKVL